MKRLLVIAATVAAFVAASVSAGPVNPHPNQTLVSETPQWEMVIEITGTDSGVEYIFQWSADAGATWNDSTDGQTFIGGLGASGELFAPYPWENIQTRAVPYLGPQ